MKYLPSILLPLVTLLPMHLTFAHEGHATPGAVQARHGGTIKQSPNLFLELVTEADTVNLYPMDHDYKPVPLENVKLDGVVEFPKGKKGAGKLILSRHVVAEEGMSHFMGTVVANGANRFTIKVKATYLEKSGEVKYTVEPK